MSPGSVPRGPRPWTVIGAFLALTLVLTWPLVTVLTTRVPGTATWASDESTFLWNNWYFQHALLDLHINPLHTDLIWYPLGVDLTLYTYDLFNAAVALPLQVAANVPLASNLTLILATVLSGYGAYLLALYCLGRPRRRRDGISRGGTGANGSGTGATCLGRGAEPACLAAMLAGLIYAFGSNRAVYMALGHYNIATTEWLPFYALYLLRLLREPGRRSAWLAGLFLALAVYAEMTFATFLALLSLVVLLALWRRLGDRRAALGRLALAGLTGALLAAPVLAPAAYALVRPDTGPGGWAGSLSLSADLVGLLTPTALNPLFSTAQPAPVGTEPDRWQAALRAVVEGKGPFSDVNTAFLGFVTIVLAVIGAMAGRTRTVCARGPSLSPDRGAAAQASARTGDATGPWIWTGLVFAVLALGPLLQVSGRYRFSLDRLVPEGVTIPLPFALLHFLPFVNANRAPNRFSVILMLALAVLAALGAHWLFAQMCSPLTRAQGIRPRLLRPAMRLLAAALAIAVLAEHLALPLPTTDATIPDVYSQIAAEPGEFSILQLPLGWRNSFGTLGSELTLLQYYQSAHGKAMLGGNISRQPAFKMAYFERIPLFRALTGLEMYREVPSETDTAARRQAGALMALYDVRYFITFPPIPGRYPYQDTWQRTQAYAVDVLPLETPAFWSQDGIRAYRVRQPPIPDPFVLALGISGTEPYLGDGWDLTLDEKPYGIPASWVVAQSAELYLPMAAPAAATLQIRIAPLAYPSAPPQTLTVDVNGAQVLARRTLAPGWQTLFLPVPEPATRKGPNRVTLSFAWTASPREVFPDAASRAMIGETGVASPVNLEVHSFDHAYISATAGDGVTVNAPLDAPGYNVAVFDPHSGSLRDRAAFDTAGDAGAGDRLAAYLAEIRPGDMVVVARRDPQRTGPGALPASAVAALRNLGSRVAQPVELVGKAYALVGIQGARPGAATEVIEAGDAFLQLTGDFRPLAAAVAWVELRK